MNQWTRQQEEAIYTRHASLLVSAAAGSGKTAVLVERILQKVMGDKIDIDRILVVTFTKAAASQMKSRISAALEKQLETDPANEHLQRQSALIHQAPISTIDSFCLQVVRSNIQQTDADPDFRVADPDEMVLLQRDVLDKLLEEAYSSGDPSFLRLVDNFEPQVREGALAESVLDLYTYSQAYPWPALWRRNALKTYEASDEAALGETLWMQRLVEDIRRRAKDAADRLRILSEHAVIGTPEPEKGYRYTLQKDAERLQILADAESYRELYEGAASMEWPRIGSKKGEDPVVYESAKAARDEIKKTFKEQLIPHFLSTPPELFLELLNQTKPVAEALLDLTDRFEKAFDEAKRNRGVMDFSDVEHYALRILTKAEGDASPSETAAVYREQFEEIMIDEYQDANLVQEILLRAVSREADGSGNNRFMVGDVKQSIYRFRQAMPELFIEKYHTYSPEKGAGRHRIELQKNFRSRPEVLSSVNRIFRRIMQSDVGAVTYDALAELNPGADFPEGKAPDAYQSEMWLLDTASEEEAEETAGEDAAEEGMAEQSPAYEEPIAGEEQEAYVCGRRILAMVGKDSICDPRTGTTRCVRFGDIAVLMRAVSGHAQVYLDVFRQMGIPAYSGSSTGYFEASEVRCVLSYLRVLDNPRQDIPLAAALRCAIGGFTDDEITLLRLHGTGGMLWDDLSAAWEAAWPEERFREKIDRFYCMTEQFRKLVRLLPLHELIWRVLAETGFLDAVSAMPAGEQRRANINMLVEKAAAFEKGTYRGLFHFLRYIETIQTYEIDYGEAPLAGEGTDAVQIMSIHKSKGLEFPVVIAAGMGHRFNRRESAKPLIMHPQYGLAVRLVDPERHMQIDTPLMRIFAHLNQLEDQGEQLRILYVAMTRAKEKLILTAAAGSSAWDRLLETETVEGDALSFYTRSSAPSPAALIVPALLQEKRMKGDSGFRLERITVHQRSEGLAEPENRKEYQEVKDIHIDPEVVYDADTAAQLTRICKETYAFEDRQQIPAKVSVSQIKAAAYEEEQQRLMELFREDGEDAVQSLGGRGGARRGTVIHTLLEAFTPEWPVDRNVYERQLERLVKCGKIHEGETGLLTWETFAPFFASDIYKRMYQAFTAGRLYREMPFTASRQACELKEEWQGDETVLVQGIIDVWFYDTDGMIVLLDYKTDAVPKGERDSLIRKYKKQLDLYADALERGTGAKVKEKQIWSFALSESLSVDDPEQQIGV